MCHDDEPVAETTEMRYFTVYADDYKVLNEIRDEGMSGRDIDVQLSSKNRWVMIERATPYGRHNSIVYCPPVSRPLLPSSWYDINLN